MCESFFSTLECALLARRQFASQAEAKIACYSYIEGFYNPIRLYSALGCCLPLVCVHRAHTTGGGVANAAEFLVFCCSYH